MFLGKISLEVIRLKHEVDLKNYEIRTDLALESLKNHSVTEFQNEIEREDDIQQLT